MKFYVGVTDNEWFRFLSERKPDEVNFWRPRSQVDFQAISPGSLFLFKLHSPLNYIVGGGVYVRHVFLSIALTWEVFGEKNGVPDYRSLESQILKHRGKDELGRQIGCTVLVQPFFWPRDQWIPMQDDWKPSIVTGKGYEVSTVEGASLWEKVQSRMAIPQAVSEYRVAEDAPRFGEAYLIRPRLGQGAFRIEVTQEYQRRCAFTGEKTLPALEAAHIRPYAEDGPHEVRNGILLRSDLHNLFDQGYLTLSSDYRIEVSRRIREEFENGRDYYALHGRRLLVVPGAENNRPAPEYLEWHQKNRYLS